MAHASSSAGKKAAMRAAPEEDPEFQIAPMIDILLVLLVFFMSIASTEVLQTNQALKLPVAKDAAPSGKNKGQSIVNVLWSEMGGGTGTIEVDQRPFAQAADLVPYLTAKVADVPDMRILLRADKNVRYEYLRSLLSAIGNAGIGNVTFSVVDKEQSPAPAAE
ncbi:MAG: biopolymer transporter ExbD [Verrucomicrobiaceae bacterium]|nr:MAG: biopolymer transporter ExbD [Verrucomicrobiaceae bacterium]